MRFQFFPVGLTLEKFNNCEGKTSKLYSLLLSQICRSFSEGRVCVKLSCSIFQENGLLSDVTSPIFLLRIQGTGQYLQFSVEDEAKKVYLRENV